jgi:ankyrin repeat protein
VTAVLELMRAIVGGDATTVDHLLVERPALATAALATGASRQRAEPYFFTAIAHYVYAGDTALHVAAAAHRPAIARALVAAGAGVAARNRRGAAPLHYAVDGGPGHPHWDRAAQVATIAALLAAGADVDVTDKGGVTPLHRAVRNRCADAVRTLLAAGADPRRANGRGSRPLQLAHQTTGRGGSGSPEAKAEQAEIVRLLSAMR